MPSSNIGKGIDTVFASNFVVGPLIARNQPLAVAFTISRAAQIIGVMGRNYLRFQTLGSWPTGTDVTSLGDSGEGIYRTRFQR